MEGKKRTLTKWLYWFVFAVAVILVYKTEKYLYGLKSCFQF